MKDELIILIDSVGLRPADIVKFTDGISLQQASRWLKQIKGGKSTLAIDNLVKKVCQEIQRPPTLLEQVNAALKVPETKPEPMPSVEERGDGTIYDTVFYDKDGNIEPERIFYDNPKTVVLTEVPDNLAKPKAETIESLKNDLGLKKASDIEKPAESVYDAFEKFTLDPSDFIIVEVRNSTCKYLEYPNTFRKEGNIIKFKLTKSIMEFTIPDGLVDKVEFTKDARRCRLTGEFLSDMGDITDVDYPDNPELKGKADKVLIGRKSVYPYAPEDYEIVAQPYYGPFVDCDEKRFVRAGIVIHFKYNKEFFVVTMEEGKRVILFEQGGVWYQASSTANFGGKSGAITVTKK